jgi:deoxyribodipyrimidine photo-lyase
VLRYRCGSALTELLALIADTGADTLYYNRVYEPWFWDRDRTISEVLTGSGITVHQSACVVLYEPDVTTPDDRHRPTFDTILF